MRVGVGDGGRHDALVDQVEPVAGVLPEEEIDDLAAALADPDLERVEVVGEVVGHARVQAARRRRHARRGRLDAGVDCQAGASVDAEVAVDVVDLHRVGAARVVAVRQADDRLRSFAVEAGRRVVLPVRSRAAMVDEPVVGQQRIVVERPGIEVPVVEGGDLLADGGRDQGADAEIGDRGSEIRAVPVVGGGEEVDALADHRDDSVGAADGGVGAVDRVDVEVAGDEAGAVHHALDDAVEVGGGAGGDGHVGEVDGVLGTVRNVDAVAARLEGELTGVAGVIGVGRERHAERIPVFAGIAEDAGRVGDDAGDVLRDAGVVRRIEADDRHASRERVGVFVDNRDVQGAGGR